MSLPDLADRFGPEFVSSIELEISEDTVRAFADLTGDHSSLHMSEEFARGSLYGRRIVHGMLPIAHLAVCPGIRVEGCQARLMSIDGHFSSPVHIGDRIVLRIAGREQLEPTRVALEYRIEHADRKSLATAGRIELAYRESAAGEAVGAADSEQAICMLCASLTEMDRSIEDIRKGDREELDFVVTAGNASRLLEILRSSVREPQMQEIGNASCDASDLLGVMLLSTLVGMRMPGRSATFVDFAVGVVEPLRLDEAYRLAGEVKHVSRGTHIVKTAIAITPAEGGAPALQGALVTLANPSRAATSAAEDLRADVLEPGLRGRVVLITGASRGIGATTAKLFARLGARVVVNYRSSSDEAERVISEIRATGGEAVAIAADVSRLDQVRAMFDEILDRFGRIDVLVNNAVRDFRSIAYENLSWEDVQGDLDVALKGSFYCCQLAVPHMVAAGAGKIVNISSVFADDPPPDQLKYVVSKSALIGLTRGLAAELAGKNIQVNAVVPSFVETEVASRMHEAIMRRRAKASPMKRNASKEDVAHAVVFLASSFSSYTTGQRLLVTGGGAPYL